MYNINSSRPPLCKLGMKITKINVLWPLFLDLTGTRLLFSVLLHLACEGIRNNFEITLLQHG